MIYTESYSGKKLWLLVAIFVFILVQTACSHSKNDLSKNDSQNVIKKYFEIVNNNDSDELDKLFFTPRTKTNESVPDLEFKNIKSREILMIEEVMGDEGKGNKKEYLASGLGATHEIQYNNLKVYKVQFKLENFDDAIAVLQSGVYEWYFYVVWVEEKNEWLIHDLGNL